MFVSHIIFKGLHNDLELYYRVCVVLELNMLYPKAFYIMRKAPCCNP
jgi:hypothetical protein